MAPFISFGFVLSFSWVSGLPAAGTAGAFCFCVYILYTEPKKTHLPGGFSERSEDLSLCPPQALKFLNSTLYVEISLGLPTREKP